MQDTSHQAAYIKHISISVQLWTTAAGCYYCQSTNQPTKQTFNIVANG